MNDSSDICCCMYIRLAQLISISSNSKKWNINQRRRITSLSFFEVMVLTSIKGGIIEYEVLLKAKLKFN